MTQILNKPYGQQANNTWRNCRNVLDLLDADEFAVASPILAGPQNTEAAQQLLDCLNHALIRIQKEETQQQRMRNWKVKLQSSLRAQHAWLRHDTKQQQKLCFQDTDGHLTANVQDQFIAVRNAWAAVTDLFKHQEPDRDQFGMVILFLIVHTKLSH